MKRAVEAFQADGYTEIERHAKSLPESQLVDSLQDAYFIGYDKKIAALKTRLDPDLDLDWAQGRAMPVEQAVSDALLMGL